MPNKLGDVWMEFKLSVADAQTDLTSLERKIQKDGGKGTLTVTPGGPTGGITTVADRQKESYLKQLSSAVIKKAGGGLQGSPVASFAQTLTGQVVDFVPPPVQRGLMFAAKIAATYGIVSETAKVLPQAFALGEELAGTKGNTEYKLEVMRNVLDELRQKVVALESKVVGVVQGISKTLDFTEAARRLTGQMPNSLYYFTRNQSLKDQKNQMDEAFTNWKRKEAPLNTIMTVADSFKRFFNR